VRRPPVAVAAAIVAVVIVVAVVVVSCGNSEEKTLRETSEKLSEVRSGQLAMRFTVAALSTARDSDVGFAIKGRFALATRPRGLPDADLAYTQIAGPEQETVRIVSDGQAAWVRVGGQAYTLPADRTRRLRRSADGDGGEGAAGLDVLRIDRWIADPKSSDGSEIDGVATTRITGKLRVATALRDLLALGRRAGTDVGAKPIGEETSEKLEEAKEGDSITLHTGKDDRILRRLVLRARFPLERTRDLGGTIGRLRGAEVRFSLSLRRVGRAVRVQRPANPQPYAALSGGA
jgi:hypothetical protein